MFEGKYIVIEGIDGTGKSTLIANLKQRLEDLGVTVTTCVEPTDGSYGQQIRQYLGDKSKELSADEWMTLFESDRRENIEQYVKPALANKHCVLQDRSFYSTAAYQGAQGLDPQKILERNRAFAPEPDLVVILDLEPAEAIQRIREKRTMETDNFEKEDYLERVRAIFQGFSGSNIFHLSAAAPAEEIAESVYARAAPLSQ